MTCPNCQSNDTAILTEYVRRWSVLIFKDRRVGDGPVEREQRDYGKCLDCGNKWRIDGR